MTAAEPFRIVLVAPLIPQNTGSIARMCAATNTELHLVKPLGFELSDRYLKRAGLDYWQEVILFVHESWDMFLSSTNIRPEQLWFFTKFSERSYTHVQYQPRDVLVFGNETSGLPDMIHETYADRCLRIPMENPNVRSLNLATAAGIALYEARRQIGD